MQLDERESGNWTIADNLLHRRFIEPRLVEALEDSPAVLIQGPRQCGKTTLVQMVCAPEHLPGSVAQIPRVENRGYGYISFDDDVVRSAAEIDPMGFIAELPERVVLDEIQRVPGLFTGLKLELDRRRTPGRFVLTGSTNVLAVPNVQESLAGRLEMVSLYPMAQSELHVGQPDARGFIDRLFNDGFPIRQTTRLGKDLIDRIIAGGYPPALARPTERRRSNWYRNFIEAQVQRDVSDVSRIRGIALLPRLLQLVATQTAQLFNVSSLSAPFELSRTTIGDYVELLKRVYLLEVLPPWYSNLGKRLIKTPKIHIGDTGLAASLLRVTETALRADRSMIGALLETFVFQELRRQASWHDDPIEFFHYRDKDQVEVDVVMESSGSVAGVEVKAASTVTNSDFRGLRKLNQVCGTRFVGGVVLYDGETSVPFGERLYAVPVRFLWEGD